MDTVRKTDGNAVVVDTEKDGRKDMVLLALKLYQESKAEAVIVISNTEGTYRLVRELEAEASPLTVQFGIREHSAHTTYPCRYHRRHQHR
jgi:hypothetical protein